MQGEGVWRLVVGLVIGGQSMVFGLGLNMTPAGGPAHWVLHGLLIVSALAVMALLGRPLLENTLESIRDRELTVEMLFVASIAGAFVASLLNTFSGTGNVFYEVVAITLVIYTLGQRLRAGTRGKALKALREARDLHAFAEVEQPDGSALRVPVSEVLPGRIVRVSPGAPLPVDGVVAEGLAYVDESSLTGEPLPVVRREGDPVRAGTCPVDAPLRVRSTASEGGRELDRIFRALEEARLAPSGFQRAADRLTGWFLPVVLLISAGSFAGWWWHAGWQVALFNAMAVLLVACPCALGMATPVAVWSGLARLARQGFAARGGDFLDVLGRVDRIVFDKTGTLTDTSASVADFMLAEKSGAGRGLLRGAVAELERGLPHPLAQALARDAGDGACIQLLERSLHPGRGVEGRLRAGGRELRLRIGELEWMGAAAGAAARELETRLGGARGKRVWLEVDGALEGVFLLREHVRPEAAGLAAELERMGIRTEVLTGDPAAPAHFAGMPVRAGLSAGEKEAFVRGWVDAGETVLVVGDGLNDSAAMAAASASLAIEGGAGLATGTATAVVPPGRLRELPGAVRLGRAIRRGVRSNLVFAACYNFIGMALAASGNLHPVAAALLMLVSSLIVSVRALRSARAPAAAPLRSPA
jgi:heavy metal translocating P-type ATPase